MKSRPYKKNIQYNALFQWGLVCVFCVVTLLLNAQPDVLKGWAIEPGLHIGRMIKHTPKLTFDVKGLTTTGELYISHQTYGKKEWNQFQRYPKLGFSLFYQDLGDPDIFGEAISLVPNANIRIGHSSKFQQGFRFGVGLAYLTSPYDVINNNTNNAIGSHWNAAILFDWHIRWRLHENWQMKTGLNFLHYSNGASSLPNFGLNIPSLFVGAIYTPKVVQQTEYNHFDTPKNQDKKWGVQAWFSLAWREREIPGGPSYPIYDVSVAATYFLNKVNRLSFGVEYEYNKSVYEFGKHVYAFGSESEARWRSSRIQLFVADEFLFGNWGVTIMLGAYASSRSYLLPVPVYNKVITRYYFPAIGRLKLHAGVYLKSHIVIAEYVAFGIGISF